MLNDRINLVGLEACLLIHDLFLYRQHLYSSGTPQPITNSLTYLGALQARHDDEDTKETLISRRVLTNAFYDHVTTHGIA